MESWVPNADRLHGMVIPADRAGFVADLLTSITRHASSADPQSLVGTSRAVTELLGVAITGKARHLGDTGRLSLQTLRRGRVRAFIDANLASPDLDADRVAAAIAVSRATLYRVVAPSGGLSAFILQRRLARLRTALLARTAARTITELAHAHGFVSVSHCNRVFQQASGLPPGQFRATAAELRALPGQPQGVHAQFTAWQDEVR